MGPVTRALVASGAVILVLAILIFSLRGWGGTQIEFFDLRVVNDTHRTVQIQPCWDVDCRDTHSLPAKILRPRKAAHAGGKWSNDIGQEIVVAVRQPGAKPWQFEGCLVTQFSAGQKRGDVRVSRLRPCFTGPE